MFLEYELLFRPLNSFKAASLPGTLFTPWICISSSSLIRSFKIFTSLFFYFIVPRMTDRIVSSFVFGSLTQIFKWLTISKISSCKFLFSLIFFYNSTFPVISPLPSFPKRISAFSFVFYSRSLLRLSVRSTFSVLRAATSAFNLLI